jgi:hypothetical protein
MQSSKVNLLQSKHNNRRRPCLMCSSTPSCFAKLSCQFAAQVLFLLLWSLAGLEIGKEPAAFKIEVSEMLTCH